ncbi:MAG: hypothetical protein ACTSVV_11600 [Promethearchaeota archaeon]
MDEIKNNEEVSSEQKIKEKGKLKSFFIIAKSLSPFLLAHHPDCDEFKGHTINIGKIHLCIGCFIGYPAAIISIIIIGTFNIYKLFQSEMLLFLGLILIATFSFSFIGLTKIMIIKIIQKFAIGLGAAFLFWYIFLLPNPWIINFILFFGVFSILLGLLSLHHAHSFYSNCSSCKYEFDWSECPGFKKVRDNLKRSGFENLFDSFKSFSENIRYKKELKSQAQIKED